MKRSSYLRVDQIIPVDKAGLRVWGYGPKGRFVCRLEINAAGIEIFTGEKGGHRLAKANWERLIEKLKH